MVSIIRPLSVVLSNPAWFRLGGVFTKPDRTIAFGRVVESFCATGIFDDSPFQVLSGGDCSARPKEKLCSYGAPLAWLIALRTALLPRPPRRRKERPHPARRQGRCGGNIAVLHRPPWPVQGILFQMEQCSVLATFPQF